MDEAHKARIRKQDPAAALLAETMEGLLRGLPEPDPELQWYVEACWWRVALEQGLELPDNAAAMAAKRAYKLIPLEPASLWGRRVSGDVAPVRLIYLLEIAARLKLGAHPSAHPKSTSRKLRLEHGRWIERVAWCQAMFHGLGKCEAHMRDLIPSR